MNMEFIEAMNALEKDRHISKDILLEAIESALVSAYKKNYGTAQNVRVAIDRENGEIYVLMRRDIVEEVLDETTEISLEDARSIDVRYEVGDSIEFQVMPKDFGRIAAQTAKQVVIQRLREAERGMVYDDFITRQGELITGVVNRKHGETLFINIGTTEGIISANEQVAGENYKINDKIRAYIMDVKNSAKGPQVFLSRSHPGLVKALFELEVPEIHDGTVEIKGIAREAGSRTKISVYSEDPNVDPVGACVGAGGSRVQSIVDEINGEKIDIIPWSEDPKQLIASVLRPAKVEEVIIGQKEKEATVIVPDYQLSLAIGKEGQNVRLAAKVSGWKIDIKSASQYVPEPEVSDDDLVILDEDYDLLEASEDLLHEVVESPSDSNVDSLMDDIVQVDLMDDAEDSIEQSKEDEDMADDNTEDMTK